MLKEIIIPKLLHTSTLLLINNRTDKQEYREYENIRIIATRPTSTSTSTTTTTTLSTIVQSTI